MYLHFHLKVFWNVIDHCHKNWCREQILFPEKVFQGTDDCVKSLKRDCQCDVDWSNSEGVQKPKHDWHDVKKHISCVPFWQLGKTEWNNCYEQKERVKCCQTSEKFWKWCSTLTDNSRCTGQHNDGHAVTNQAKDWDNCEEDSFSYKPEDIFFFDLNKNKNLIFNFLSIFQNTV